MLTGTAASVCALPDDVAAVFEQLNFYFFNCHRGKTADRDVRRP